MPTTQWEKLSAQLVPLLAGLASTHPVLNLLSLASLQPVKLFKQTNHLPSLSTTTTMEKKGHSTLKAYLRKPLLIHFALKCNPRVACLSLSALFPRLSICD